MTAPDRTRAGVGREEKTTARRLGRAAQLLLEAMLVQEQVISHIKVMTCEADDTTARMAPTGTAAAQVTTAQGGL